MVSFKDITEAYTRIENIVNRTPVMTSRTLNDLTGASVYLKCENYQRVGAFKYRGVSNKLARLSAEERKRGVITHSSGNHAQAVALAASSLGIEAVVVMPENAPLVKVNATKSYGAKIVRSENSIESREQTCRRLIEKNGYTMVHPYDDDQIIAGAGTAALELLTQCPDLDYVFCPVGGGGLLSGTAVATRGVRSDSKIIGVEPERADDAFRSLRDGVVYPSDYPDTIADGLRTALSARTFRHIKEHVDRIETVSETEIVDAMTFLWTRMKIVVEPSGAVPVAGLFRLADEIRGRRVGAIISGGNVDLDDFFDGYYRKIRDSSSDPDRRD